MHFCVCVLLIDCIFVFHSSFCLGQGHYSESEGRQTKMSGSKKGQLVYCNITQENTTLLIPDMHLYDYNTICIGDGVVY